MLQSYKQIIQRKFITPCTMVALHVFEELQEMMPIMFQQGLLKWLDFKRFGQTIVCLR